MLNEMKTCDSCKYWFHKKDGHSDRQFAITNPEDVDTDDGKMEIKFDVRKCHSPNILFYERPITENQACVIDGSAYRGSLLTGPKFGCPNHENIFRLSGFGSTALHTSRVIPLQQAKPPLPGICRDYRTSH